MSQAAARVDIEPRVPRAAVEALAAVVDPEIPVLTIEDLGILRGLHMDEDTLVVRITPTYSGCPAMVQIRDDIRAALENAGVADFRVETVLAPAWTTDWMSEEGRRKLLEYGIAPPQGRGEDAAPTSLSGRLPPMWQRQHTPGQRVWLHRLQGALPVQGLPRTLRPLQVPLSRSA